MVTRSKRIVLHDEEKLKQVNPETIRLLDKYKVDMAVRDLSESTQRQYIYNLQQWFIYILDKQKNRSVLLLDDDDITEFLYFCKSEGNNTARMKVRIATISAFYKFLRKKHYLSTNPTEFIDSPKKHTPVIVQTFLTTEQIALMREKLISHGNIQLRLYAILSLATMARCTAIASIKWNQIDIKECVIHDVLEKEGKMVDLYFNDEVKYLLESLKQERIAKKCNDNGWLWYSGRTTPEKHISPATLNDWTKVIGRMIGCPSMHTHDWRHTKATLLKNAGMPLEDISVLLNHESVDTTRRFYIKHDIARINNFKNKINL